MEGQRGKGERGIEGKGEWRVEKREGGEIRGV